MAITAKKLGVIGEDIAAKYLQDHGYEVVVFGGDGIDRNARLTSTLPRYHLGWLGSSRLNIGVLSRRYDNNWIDGDLPIWADLSDSDVSILTSVCRKKSKCYMRDQGKEDSPCYENDNPFLRGNIDRKYPKGRPSYILDGKELQVSAIHAVGDCSTRLNTLLKFDYEGGLIPNGGFIKDNAVISSYIEQVWYQYLSRNHDAFIGGISDEDLNRFPKSHPGRYDFLARGKDGVICAVEVKVNSSKMNYWQCLRFQLLNEMGHKTMLLHIKGKAEEIESARDSGDLNAITLTEMINPDVSVDILDGYDFYTVMSSSEPPPHEF